MGWEEIIDCFDIKRRNILPGAIKYQISNGSDKILLKANIKILRYKIVEIKHLVSSHPISVKPNWYKTEAAENKTLIERQGLWYWLQLHKKQTLLYLVKILKGAFHININFMFQCLGIAATLLLFKMLDFGPSF